MLWISSLIIAVVLALIINAALRPLAMTEPKVQANKPITPHAKIKKAYQNATMTCVSLQPSDFEPIDAGDLKFRRYRNKFVSTEHRGFLEFYVVILFVKVMCLSILLGN